MDRSVFRDLAVADDGMGEFRIDVSSIRLRSEHAASVDDAMREAMAERLVEEYGDAEGAADAVGSGRRSQRSDARQSVAIRRSNIAENSPR
jgi:hypothetical protein